MARKSKAYNEGCEGYSDWLSHDDCPYDSGSKEYVEWIKGWRDSKADNEEVEEDDEDDN